MAQVTIELRHLINTDFKLFDYTYACSDSVWKDELEQAIIDYYYFEEIGAETADRFKHIFKTKMMLIMPFYDKLHELSKIDLNPNALLNYKMTETLSRVKDRALINSGSDSNTSDIATDSKNTDYPQHLNIEEDIPSGRSVSNSDSTNVVTFGSKQDENNTEETTKVVEGYTNITLMELQKQYRDNLIRINEEIIRELKTCFILVY